MNQPPLTIIRRSYHQDLSLRGKERGIQLVEVTLVMPVLLLLLAGTAEFGRYFYTYSTLSRATQVAARYLGGNIYTAAKRDEAFNLALCGQIAACSSNYVVPGLQANSFSVAPAIGSLNFPSTVTVTVTYTGYQPIFNLGNWVNRNWSNLTMTASTTVRYQLEN
jgi:Flp pilus assembly protein TadG